jgi:membrane dipeptidase
MLKDLLVKATSAEDIRRAKRDGKHAIMWNCQNTHGFAGGVDLEEDLKKIDLFFSLGFRVIQLTYNLRNAVGDGCLERYESGLTRFGLKFVERMNELGMLIDTSHCGYQTTLDAVEHSHNPVSATHITCREVYDHPRGKTDEELKAIVEKGGYIGINMIPAFIGGKGDLNQFLDHLDYAVDLVGVDSIGIGTDTGHRDLRPEVPVARRWWTGFRPEHLALGLDMRADEMSFGSLAWVNWPLYTVGLVSRGYSDQEIQKIIGGNALNIIEGVIG